MAEEIDIMIDCTLRNGNVENDFQPATVSVDQTNGKFSDRILVIGTSVETITFGDLTSVGYVMLHNTDSTNYVTIGPQESDGSMEPMIKINAGEIACLRLDPSATIKAQANTADVKLRVDAYDN
tara:strand:+ start:3643 stop:4014 length:372 start_codon:yes stop_codon:yes gene_type:complete